MTDVLDDLQWRGLIALSTDLDALRAELAKGPITYYCGFDPTGPSLHFGHLTQVITVRRLQLAGNRPLALVGGATGLIGDPRPTAERTLHDRGVVGALRVRPVRRDRGAGGPRSRAAVLRRSVEDRVAVGTDLEHAAVG